MLMVLGKKDVLNTTCVRAAIGQDVVLSIPSGLCDLGGSWNGG